MLASPTTIPGEASGSAPTPVHLIGFVCPVAVFPAIIRHLSDPVPRARIEDILKRRNLGLREDGKEVMRDVEGIGAIKKAESSLQGGRVAYIREGSSIVDEA